MSRWLPGIPKLGTRCYIASFSMGAVMSSAPLIVRRCCNVHGQPPSSRIQASLPSVQVTLVFSHWLAQPLSAWEQVIERSFCF